MDPVVIANLLYHFVGTHIKTQIISSFFNVNISIISETHQE